MVYYEIVLNFWENKIILVVIKNVIFGIII